MDKEIFKVFNIFKYTNREKLIITQENEKLFVDSYMKDKLYKKLTYNKWRNCVINYSVEKCIPFNESIKYFIEYKKSNSK